MKSSTIELTKIEAEKDDSMQSFSTEKNNKYTSNQDLEMYIKVGRKQHLNLSEEDLSATESIKKNSVVSQENRKLIERNAVLQVCADQEEDLLQERSKIIKDKYLGDGISKDQAKRIKYINWMLDRIEDAKSGDYLDLLETTVKSQKLISNDLTSFLDEVEKIRQKNPRKNRC